jgi:hypothetical protein
MEDDEKSVTHFEGSVSGPVHTGTGNIIVNIQTASQQGGDIAENVVAALPRRPYRQLIGRDDKRERALAELRNPHGQPIVALTGLGGIGKTALAYEITLRALQEGLFLSAAWVSAKQQEFVGGEIKHLSSPTLRFETLIQQVAEQLRYSEVAHQRPQDIVSSMRHILRTEKHLVVVDNLETIEDYDSLVHSLRELLGASRAIFTARPQLDFDFVLGLNLRGLSESESMLFLRSEAQAIDAPGIWRAEDETLLEVHSAVAGAPLAMKLVVAEVKQGLGLERIIIRLKQAVGEEQLYRFIYLDLWSTLSEVSQQVLVAMTGFADSATRKMLQPVSRTNDTEFDGAVRQLVGLSLLDVSDHLEEAKRRYSIHQLTRNFVNSDLRFLWKKQSQGNDTK